MTYLRLKNDRLRISLTRYETEQIFGSADGIDKSDPRAQIALKMLLKRAIRLNNFKPNCNSVWVEIAKNLSGGYDIYFIKGRSVGEDAPMLILEFKSCSDAIEASKAIKALGGSRKSSFYRISGRYRIIVSAENGVCDLPVAVEFADSISVSTVDAASTREHGKEIINTNAIEILAEL